MNKYQETLDRLETISSEDIGEVLVGEIFTSEIKILQELIDMHTQPLKPEEIKPNMWVWDNKEKQYHLVKSVDWHGIPCWEIVDRFGKYKDFEENRFYRYQPLEV